ncbi:hypothetical protein NMG60_11024562 [Bertholletia excelsa]
MALKVLSALDTAKTQLYHFKAIVIAGMGLFTDAYDLFCIPPIMKLIGRVYFDSNEPKKVELPVVLTSIMLTTALLGAAIGQLLFGRLGDLIGRRRVYGISLFLMVLSSIGCGFSMGTSPGYVLGSLAFFRFVLGLGIGGDYPLSATIMSEFANRKTRGSFIAAVFSMQGLGILASSAVTMVVCSIFDAAPEHPVHPVPKNQTPESADLAWRLILMMGAIPAGLTFYWRMMMPETARYTALVEHNVLQAAKDMERVLDVSLSQIAEESEYPPSPPPCYPLISKRFFSRHGRDLFACATAWFLIDVFFYSANLVQSQIDDHYLMKKTNVFQEAISMAKLHAILNVCSTIPGYWATVYYIDRIGRVKIQIIGFFFMTLVFITIGIPYYYWYDHTNLWFLFLYGLALFFSNFGPNTTTFIVPAELFPARFRSTCYGISGAVGKVGAIVGVVGFNWASHKDEDGLKRGRMMAVLVFLAGVSIAGMMTTYFFTRETTGRSLEENEKEDDPEDGFFVRSFGRSCMRRRSNSVGQEDPTA